MALSFIKASTYVSSTRSWSVSIIPEASLLLQDMVYVNDATRQRQVVLVLGWLTKRVYITFRFAKRPFEQLPIV